MTDRRYPGRDDEIIDAVYSGEPCESIARRVGLSLSGAQAAYVRATGHGITETPLLARFCARVDTSGGRYACWPWVGSISTSGYGLLGDSYAHRLAWGLSAGPIPDGLFVCHHCDNPPCVNPDHLFLGTPRDNSHDMVLKARYWTEGLPLPRQPRGTRHGLARLDESSVRSIRARVGAGETQQSVADAFGVHLMTINHVVHGRTWKHVA